ncbi:MAG: FMN-binding negative transcriptional regulator [Acidobacteriota bacterium]|nr:FMN-binding negative transcriptional regulator [Acidobacteriota bacterium]
MYLPRHNHADPRQTRELLQGIRAADLITPTADGLFATFLPLIYEAPAGDADELGSLLGHVARRNEHWQLRPSGESLVIVHGPDAYITPSWYASKRAHGRVVPTWDYLIAHIHGELRIHDDAAWVERLVRRLTDRHEAPRAHPWAVDDAPRSYIDGQLRAIVGVELRISRIEAKAKLSQNYSLADRQGTVAGLRTDGHDAIADQLARGLPDAVPSSEP